MGFKCWISVGKLSYKNRASSHYIVMVQWTIFADVKEPSALSQMVSYIASMAANDLQLRMAPNSERVVAGSDKFSVV